VRAARLHGIGETPRVEEVPDPSGPNLIRVAVAGLNPVDVSTAEGRFYGGTPGLPYIVGGEAVGTTEDGRRVWTRSRATVAEWAPTDPAWTFEVPAGLDESVAVACGIAGLTAWLAVRWRAEVNENDTVLVLGASGTVGRTAVQAAKLLGAKRVIGAARRTARVPSAADDVVELGEEYELPRASVIIDALWGEPSERALAAAAPGVRLVQLGQSAGSVARLQSSWVRGKVANVLGFSLYPIPAEVAAAAYAELCGHARDGRISFDFEVFAMDRFGAAWERQASGSPGLKVVVDPTATLTSP